MAVHGAAQSASTAAKPAQSSVPTIKANTQLVVVDVVVTDSSHRPVRGLKATDFALTENGAPQTLKNFEEHSAQNTADAMHMQPMPKLPPGNFTNYTPIPANGAVNIVLLDTLNTPMSDQTYVRQQLLAYLRAKPPGTRVAIFGLTNRLVILQGFTSDPEVLLSVLTKGRAKGSPLLQDEVGGQGVQESLSDHMEDLNIDPSMVADVRQFEAETQSYQLQLRIKYTLDAFNQLARYLSNIPGRKNLVWFSGSFPINILPDATGTLEHPFAVMASYTDEFRETVNMLGRSQVAVYPVDARGITLSPVFDVASKRYSSPRAVARMSQDDEKYNADTVSEHGTMNAMADATGGHAFYNTNDLTSAAGEAVDMGSNFYTLAYTPANSKLDGRLHKIKIVSARRGLTLSYRQGYYADPEKVDTRISIAASAPHDQAVSTGGGLSQQETLRLAMMRGAPTPTEILMQVGVMPMPTKSEDTVAPGNNATSKGHGPWRRYSVNFQIAAGNVGNVVFVRGADEKAHADFELVTFVYSPDGILLNTLDNTVHIAEPMDVARQLMENGIACHEEVSAPAKGESFLRIAVHDLHRDRYGAVEVATSQVKDVVPVQVPSRPDAGAAPGK
jgi:VWFA-related protein